MAQSEHHTDPWRVKLVLHYEGRNFCGWQIQRNRRTVQGELSALLGRLCGDPAPTITAAGRTDRGVHATGQVASALIPRRYSPGELRKALNALAPPDLWIASAEKVPEAFHPRYDAISRTYVYRVGISQASGSPFHAPWCWVLGHGFDLERVKQATRPLIGSHDFSAFAKSGQPERGVQCHVFSAHWGPARSGADILEFEITADRFLHRMVRYLVRTLVEIGEQRRGVEEMARLLGPEPRPRAAAPAPAQGLFLTRVEYSTGQANNEGAATIQGGSE